MAKKKQTSIAAGKRYSEIDPCIVCIFNNAVMLGFISDSTGTSNPSSDALEEFGFASFFDIPDDYHHIIQLPNADVVAMYAGKSFFGLKREPIADVIKSLMFPSDASLQLSGKIIYDRLKEEINTKEQYPYIQLFQFQKVPEKLQKAYRKDYSLSFAEIDFTDSFNPVKVYDHYEISEYECKKLVFGMPNTLNRIYYDNDPCYYNDDGFPNEIYLNYVMETFVGNIQSQNPNSIAINGKQHILAFTPMGSKWYRNGYEL